MKLILAKRSRDFTRAASALASCMFEREILVTETRLSEKIEDSEKSSKWQYDFFVDDSELTLSRSDESEFKRELKKLTGVETFIACGDQFIPESVEGIPCITRHPDYPIWYSTQRLQIQEVGLDAVPSKVECKYCDKLNKNKFIARTQMAIAMLKSDIDPEQIRAIDYNYSAINMVVNCCFDPTDIQLQEAKGYYSALLMRQKLSSSGIPSMIHPSGDKPVVAYIATLPFDGLKTIKSKKKMSYMDMTIVEIGLAKDDISGLVPIA